MPETQRTTATPAMGDSGPRGHGLLRSAGDVGRRYGVLNEIGQGGMGTVYRTLDRLTGRVVTLKRPRVDHETNHVSLDEATLTLADEFRFLASLRHPNIVSVLDYGFDEDGLPFFTMDLEENAQTIVAAGLGKPFAVQVELLAQVLRALVYLHHQGIVHRDLKPENVVVVGDQVRLLDFGLAIRRQTHTDRGGWAGTFPYVAPEVLRGEPAAERADLYAFGMIAYELFLGGDPFAGMDGASLHQYLLSATLPRDDDELDDRLRPLLRGLLACRPEDRLASAAEVLRSLAATLGQPLAVETIATRESFLQAAPLVGRGAELAQVRSILHDAREGRGGAWLVGGESGVGKSRLLDEMRTGALVDGMLVLRGQGRGQAGGPYHVWRDVVSELVLRGQPDVDAAAVLQAVVPEAARLVEGALPDAPALDAEATQIRLFLAVEDLFRRQRGAVLVLLEDLQWVGSESLRMLSWLSRVAPGLSLVLVGSYRDDEAPDLPSAVTGASVLALRRLDAGEIATLGEAIIGPSARQPRLLTLLERETEGIPFFVVEVVRALAESAGELERIADVRLPERVVSGGLQRVIRRRLNRVPAWTLTALRTTAVAGRVVDRELVTAVHPELPYDDWVGSCAAAAVLELRDYQWRFSHDKVREQLLAELPADAMAALHRDIALALERLDGADVVGALAHHWREAGDGGREVVYAYRAGVLALESGALREALAHLERTANLVHTLGPGVGGAPDLSTVEAGLTEACYRLGDLQGCREHAARALRGLGSAMPSGGVGFAVAAAWEIVRRLRRSAPRVRSADPTATAAIARVQMRLIDTYFYSLEAGPLVWAVLRMMNECERASPSPELARAYVLGGLLASMVPLRSVAERWCARSLAIAERVGSAADVGWVLARKGVLELSFCRWDAAREATKRAHAIGAEVRDVRLWEETGVEAGLIDFYSGHLERAMESLEAVYESARRSGSSQYVSGARLLQADVLLRRGRDREALDLYAEVLTGLSTVDRLSDRSTWTMTLSMQALARLRTGDRKGAYESAMQALAFLAESAPVGYWMQQGTAATAEVLLTLFESRRAPSSAMPALRRDALSAVGAVVRFARRFPMGKPQSLLQRARMAWVEGRPRLAMRRWRRAVEAAARGGLPYEEACAHLEMGRRLKNDERGRLEHLEAAETRFRQLGCATPPDLVPRIDP